MFTLYMQIRLEAILLSLPSTRNCYRRRKETKGEATCIYVHSKKRDFNTGRTAVGRDEEKLKQKEEGWEGGKKEIKLGGGDGERLLVDGQMRKGVSLPSTCFYLLVLFTVSWYSE